MKVSIVLTTVLVGLATAVPLVNIIVIEGKEDVDIVVIEGNENTQTCVSAGNRCGPGYGGTCCPGLQCVPVCFLCVANMASNSQLT